MSQMCVEIDWSSERRSHCHHYKQICHQNSKKVWIQQRQFFQLSNCSSRHRSHSWIMIIRIDFMSVEFEIRNQRFSWIHDHLLLIVLSHNLNTMLFSEHLISQIVRLKESVNYSSWKTLIKYTLISVKLWNVIIETETKSSWWFKNW
jgi:hypothetical protein